MPQRGRLRCPLGCTLCSWVLSGENPWSRCRGCRSLGRLDRVVALAGRLGQWRLLQVNCSVGQGLGQVRGKELLLGSPVVVAVDVLSRLGQVVGHFRHVL